MEINKHGVSRDVPDDVKREIRRAAGFGCVCCGLAIGMYEHIDPEFHDAKEHDPRRMTYLCGACHDRVTRGIWSKQKIKEARETPWCLTTGHPHDAFDVGAAGATIWLGPNKVVNVPTLLKVKEKSLLAIQQPEREGLPYRISGEFYDDDGQFLFAIRNNEWFGEVSAWDIECVGPRITIRKAHREISLQLRALPREGIVVERADFPFEGTRLYVNSEEATVTSPKQAAIRILGREIIGNGENGILFSVDDEGQLEMGPGPFSVGASTRMPHLPALSTPRVGRNDACPCGSGTKFKRCCGQP